MVIVFINGIFNKTTISHSLRGPNCVVVALHRILHPETTCLLWPVHIGPWVVTLDRFHCTKKKFALVFSMINFSYVSAHSSQIQGSKYL